jgi:hypothetical protein
VQRALSGALGGDRGVSPKSLNRETRSLPFEFVKQNLDAILANLPREVGEDFAAALPSPGCNFCAAAGRAQVDEFFKDRVKEYTGGPRKWRKRWSPSTCAARALRRSRRGSRSISEVID